MDDARPEDRQTPDNKEEQGTLDKVKSLAPLASAVIQLIELILKLIGIIR
ncbi:MAG: hypothetical protein LBG12_13700 [Synergistaceae bacterium]|jgi:hypothetical protein|nr:hypothetical protein [Synergistaceae bacterium]